MNHAAALPEDAILHRAAVGHYFSGGIAAKPYRTSFAYLPLSFAPSGTTLMMSARALIAFAVAHMNDGRAPTGLESSRLRVPEECDSPPCITAERHTRIPTAWDWVDGFQRRSVASRWGGPEFFSVLYVYPERTGRQPFSPTPSMGLGLINEIMARGSRSLGPSGPSAWLT